MEFVYICRAGENEELRYSIRSINHYYPEAKIWVVGDPPSWYDGDCIRVKQTKTKYLSAFNNLAATVSSKEISKKFIIMNDDFYIMKKPESIEYLHEGLLIEKYNDYFDYYQASSYTKKIFDTNSRLKRLGYDKALSYELHVPFPVEKWKLARVLKYENLLWRSMYGNIFEVGGKQSSDVKFYETLKMGFKNYNYKKPTSPFLSTIDSSFQEIRDNVLAKKYNKKTKYEKYPIVD